MNSVYPYRSNVADGLYEKLKARVTLCTLTDAASASAIAEPLLSPSRSRGLHDSGLSPYWNTSVSAGRKAVESRTMHSNSNQTAHLADQELAAGATARQMASARIQQRDPQRTGQCSEMLTSLR
eukprot:5993946-Prymnesium_polylepis.2